MRKSDLDFWQGMAAHYSKFMRRSAPIYAEICNHIRPHLTRDMNVLELACGTGQLSFPLSPYVRLWEATDASSKMIAEAKKHRIFPASFLGTGCFPVAVCLGNL